MTFSRPTLTQLIDRARSDIETLLPGADAQLKNSVEFILARVVAGAAHGLHGHLVWLSSQLFPDTAEAEYIARWAGIFGLSRLEATPATGTLEVTGTSSTVCPAGTQWQTGSGLIYTQTEDVTLVMGTGNAIVEADVAGADGNQIVGVDMTIVSPVAGIDSGATVNGSGLINGANAESDEALLARLLLRLQNPPKGGGPNDYVQWMLECNGVTRAWEYPAVDGYGTVACRFVMDNKVGTIVPTTGEAAIVQAYLDSKAPVTADVTVYIPTEAAVDFTIELDPDTTAIRTAVQEALEEFFLYNAEPGGTLLLSQLNEVISLAAGEVDHTMTVPAADVTHTANQMPVLGTITWV